jgi:serine/threonine-protein kinase
VKRVVVERGALLGKYRLESLLGTGGMAEVWKARLEGPAGFERFVVVKRVLPHLARDEQFVDMFLSEARLSARLLHPNIVQVYELGQLGGEYFMAMEYLDGEDLAKIQRAGVRFPIGVAASIALNISRALAYAHGLTDTSTGAPLHLVHRDVSPSNILVGRDGTVKLLDFGIAKALAVPSDRRTETGVQRGKLSYMSPEQLAGEAIDSRVDVYALGVVLHELLSGTRLFNARGSERSEVAPPSSLNPEVPPALDGIVLGALAADPGARTPSAEALANDLEPYAIGYGVTQIARTFAPYFESVAANSEENTESGSVPAEAEPARRGSWRFGVGLALGATALVVGAAVGLGRVGSSAQPSVAMPSAVATPAATPAAPPAQPELVAPTAADPSVRPPAPAPTRTAPKHTPARRHVQRKSEAFDPESARPPR